MCGRGSTIDTNWDVFSKLVAILEDHNHVYLEVNLELGVVEGGTRVDLWEQHIQWHLQPTNHISIGHLYVLYLGGVSFVFELLDTDKLDLY